jgi:uncharacterized membrane protein YfcA
MTFPVSGVHVHPLVPFVVAFVVSAVMSTGGVSGAFVLLPFQVSVLGFSGPGVTPTNHLFNVVAIPSGVYRYVREGRMVWPLTTVIIIGTVPGVVLGSLARVYLLHDARNFKLFMGLVLALIGSRIVKKVMARGGPAPRPPAAGAFEVKTVRFDLARVEYEYQDKVYGVSSWKLGALTALIGIIGGTYGVGGGAIIAPFLVSLFGLPVHTIAGATLMGTCLTSVVGVLFFAVIGPLLGRGQIGPDWLLGLLFGFGGLLGMYAGARAQKFIPARVIEAVLAVGVTVLAVSYVVGYLQ